MKSEASLKSTTRTSLVMFLVVFVFVAFFIYQFVSALSESNMRPNADGGTTAWTCTGASCGTGHYTSVDDAVTEPTDGDASDYLTTDTNNANEWLNTSSPTDVGGTEVIVTLWVFASTGSKRTIEIRLCDREGGGTQDCTNTTTIGISQGLGWFSMADEVVVCTTWGASDCQEFANDLLIHLKQKQSAGGGGGGLANVSVAYVNLTYTASGDTEPPDPVFINPSPVNNTYTSSSTTQFNITAGETLDIGLLEIDGANTSLDMFNSTAGGIVYTYGTTGNKSYRIFTNDTAGNGNYTEFRNIVVDNTTSSLIDFQTPTPTANTFITDSTPSIYINFTEANPDSCIFQWNNGTVVNFTNSSVGVDTCGFDFNTTDSSVSIKVFVNDSAGNINQTIFRNFTVDTIPTQGIPIFTPSFPDVNGSFTCTNQSTSDPGNLPFNNIYNWEVNDVPITIINQPHDLNISDTSADAIKDYTNFFNNGTLSSGGAQPAWVDYCQVGGCYNYDTGDVITISDNETIDTQEFTLMAWINMTNVATTATIFKKDQQFILRVHGAGDDQLYGYIFTDKGTNFITASGTLSPNVWYHVAYVINSTHHTLYINGEFNITEDDSDIIQYSANDVTIGNSPTLSEGLDGLIDEVKMFNRSLSSEQIAMIYYEEFAGFTNSTIVGNETARTHETWTCFVTPNDGRYDGITSSNSTTVNGTPTDIIFVSPTPDNNDETADITPTITVTFIANTVDSCVFSFNNGTLVNFSNSTPNSGDCSFTFSSVEAVNHTVQVFINDTDGGSTNSTPIRNFNITTLTVNLGSPVTDTNFLHNNITFNASNVFSNHGIVNVSLWANFSGTWEEVFWYSNDSQINDTEYAFPYTFSGLVADGYGADKVDIQPFAIGADGVTTNGTDFWITDQINEFVYHLNSSGKNATDGFDISASGNDNSQGIAINISSGFPTDFWVSDSADNFVYHYDSIGTNLTDGFGTFETGGVSPVGLASNDTDFWYVSGNTGYANLNANVSRFDKGGTFISGFILPATQYKPTAITTNGTDLWIINWDVLLVDGAITSLDHYNQTNDLIGSIELDKAFGIKNPRGLTSDVEITGGTPNDFWIIDQIGDNTLYHLRDIQPGNYDWNILACDRSGNCTFNETNRTIIVDYSEHNTSDTDMGSGPTSDQLNVTFDVSTTYTCEATDASGTCGNITAYIKYNDSNTFPDRFVTDTDYNVNNPFFINYTQKNDDEVIQGTDNVNCDVMVDGQNCNITFQLNKTVTDTFEMEVLIESDLIGIGSLSAQPNSPDLSWDTSDEFNMSIWQSTNLNWNDGTFICNISLTDTDTDNPTCDGAVIEISTVYRAQVVLKNIGPDPARMKGGNEFVKWWYIANGWAGTAGNGFSSDKCDVNDFDGDDASDAGCSLSDSGTGELKQRVSGGGKYFDIAATTGKQGFMINFTTGTDIKNLTNSYMDTTIDSNSERSSNYTMNVTVVAGDVTDPDLVDFISPTPDDGDTFEESEVSLAITFTETNPDSCIFMFNNGTAVNFTNSSINSGDCTFNLTSSDDEVSIIVFINDTSDNINNTILRNFTIDTNHDSDANKTAIIYDRIFGEDLYEQIDNITVTVNVTLYNATGSVNNGTINHTLWLEVFDGDDWIDEGDFYVNETTGNFTANSTNITLFRNWDVESGIPPPFFINRRVRISARWIDYYRSGIFDRIAWDNVFIEVHSQQEILNDSFTEFTGTANHSNVSKYISIAVGDTIKWQVWANKTGGESNQTDVFEFTTTSAAVNVNFFISIIDGLIIVSNSTGNGTADLEINATTSNSKEVNPCVVGQSSNCQTASIGVYNFTNNGDVAVQWLAYLNTSLPSSIIVWGSLDNDPETNIIPINDTEAAVVNASIAVNGVEELWVWANFTDSSISDEIVIQLWLNSTEA